MKVRLFVFLMVLTFAADAMALSPPQYDLQQSLLHSIGRSPCVNVGEVYESEGKYYIDVRGCTGEITKSLEAILRRNWDFGGIRVVINILGPRGAVAATSVDQKVGMTMAAVESHFKTVLAENPLFIKTIGATTISPKMLWVEMDMGVIQYWNDNIDDYYGNNNEVAAKVFARLFKSSFNKGGIIVMWTTTPVKE